MKKSFILTRLSAVVFLIALLAGCATIRDARHAQKTREQPGEITRTSDAIGMTNDVYSLIALKHIALTNHPSLLQARMLVDSARLALTTTHAGRYPQVSLSAQYSRKTKNTRASNQSFTTDGSPSANLGLDLLIYDFGRISAQEQRARENIIAAEASLLSSEIDTVYAVCNAFFSLHQAQELYVIAQTNAQQYALHLQQTEDMFEAGTVQKYDITQAKLNLGNAQLDVITQSNAVIAARATLNKVLGLADNPTYAVTHETQPSYSTDATTLMTLARERSPELLMLQARERAASAYVDYAIADLFPELKLSSAFNVSDPSFPETWNWSWAVNMAQSLFQGFRKTTAVDTAVNDLRIARATLAEKEQAIYSDLVAATTKRASARAAAAIAMEVVAQAQENADLIAERYAIGDASVVDHTDAESALTEAKSNQIKAFYAEQLAEAEISRLIGEPIATPPVTEAPQETENTSALLGDLME